MKNYDNALPNDDLTFDYKVADEAANNHLDDFEALWTVTESDQASATDLNSFERIIQEQKEEILMLKEEMSIFKEENNILKNELSDLSQQKSQFSQLRQDYETILQLNRSLTKKLNNVMVLYEKEMKRIQQIKNILAS